MSVTLKLLFCLLLCCPGLSTSFCLAQSNNLNTSILYPKSVGLKIGSGHVSLQDLVFSPLVYRGSGFVTELYFVNYNQRRKHDLQLQGTNMTLLPSLDNLSNSSLRNFSQFLNYTYQRRVSNRSGFFVGAGLNTFVSVRTFEIGGQSEIGWDLFTSLNIKARCFELV